MNISLAVTLAALIMGILLFAAVFIGLHYSKKSAQKFREKNGIDTEK
jgi:uncharacterized protein YneF (UPF0154 family)